MALPVLILREGVTALFSSAVRTVSGSISTIAAASSSVKSSAILFSAINIPHLVAYFQLTGVFKAAWYARTSMMVSRRLAVLPVELLAKAFRLFSHALLSFRPDLLLPVANGCECEGDFLLP